MNAAAIVRGDLIEQLGGGESLGQIAGDLAGSGEMPKKDGEDLVRRDERAVGIHGADAVAIAIGGKAGVVASGENGFAQCRDVRLDGLRIDAAEERIASAAYLVAGEALAAHQRRQQPASGSMHGIDDEAQASGAHFFPIHQLLDGIEIGPQNIERMNLPGTRRQRGNATGQHGG